MKNFSRQLGDAVLHCNFDTTKLKISLPTYYKECLNAWAVLNAKAPKSSQEVVNEIIWNNKFLCVDKVSVYRGDIINLGFYKIGDLISSNCYFLYDCFTPLASPEQRFFLKSLVNSIPAEWRALAKASTDPPIRIDPIQNIPTIMMDSGKVVPILDFSSKQIYQIFLEKNKQVPPSAKQKLTDKYSDAVIEWEKVYCLPFCTSLESKIRVFQYKILNCIVYTNEKLYRFGLVDSPNCTFCQEDAESIEHLLFSCRISSKFWKHVLSWLKDNDICIEMLNETDLIFGKLEIKEDFILINHILLLGKYYIYSKKCQNSLPTIQGFIARIRTVLNSTLPGRSVRF